MMRHAPFLLISALSFTLVACASVPQQDQLLTGIDQTALTTGNQAAPVQRAASDAVCVDFYENVNSFYAQAKKSQGGKNFLGSLGLNVASAVLTQGLMPAGITSTAGRVAVGSAISSATSQGSQIALRELNSSNRADAKIIEVAAEIGCPVNITP